MHSRKARTAFEAVRQRRFLLGAWPWRSAAYLLTSLPVVLAGGLPLAVLALPWLLLPAYAGTSLDRFGAVVALFLLGAMLIFTVGPLVAIPLGAAERLRVRLVDTRPARSGHRVPPSPGPWSWLRTRYADPATWREFGYAALLVTVLPVLCTGVLLVVSTVVVFLVSPLLVADSTEPVSIAFREVSTVGQTVPFVVAGVVLLPAVPYLLALLAGVHGALARALLHSDPELRAELVEVTRSRARLVDAFEAERRRIERDLHDGAQQRLVALTLRLGLARLDLTPGSPAARAVTDAHDQAKQLMTELRELIRGIHPQVLTDSGLSAALQELAGHAPVPVGVDVDLPRRPPAPVETTAYFVAAEALTNIARHAGATRAAVTVRQHRGTVTLEVRDDGHGGADPAAGTGLTGLADRVSVLDGRMFLSSPVGGPTVLRVELPCR